VSGAGSDAIRAVATGCANININATGAIASSQGTGILASTQCAVTITTQPGSPVSGAVAGINATSGTGTTITLNDRVSSTAGPAINIDGAAALINVRPAGSIVGRVDLTDNADVINNAGLFQVIGTSDFRGGNDVFNNLAGGTLRLTDGAGAFANCETFNNAGTITMINGAPNNTLSICGNYVGSGAANLGIDVGVTPGGLTSDRLVIGSNSSGSTVVNLNLLGVPVIDPDGVLIVDAATATGSPFTLAGQTSFGLINLGLEQTGGDTFLVARPDAAIFDFAALGTFTQELSYQSLDAHNACSASRRNDIGRTGNFPISVCVQLYASRDRTGRSENSGTVFNTNLSFNDRLKTQRRGAQVELGFRLGESAELGVTAGYEHANADLASGTTMDADGHNYGVYGFFGSPVGFYAGALAKRDDYKIRFANPLRFAGIRPDARSTTFDGEVGYRTPAIGAMIDLNFGLTSVRTRIDDFTTGNISFDNDAMKSLRGRASARLAWSGDSAPFISGTVFHEFEGDNSITVASGLLQDRIGGRGRGTWGRVEAGFGGRGLLSGWVDLGDVRGLGARAGFRF
jgi:hypothetical protein